MVGVSGFEPPTSTSRTWRASHCATPRLCGYYSTAWGGFDNPFPAQIRKKLQFPPKQERRYGHSGPKPLALAAHAAGHRADFRTDFWTDGGGIELRRFRRVRGERGRAGSRRRPVRYCVGHLARTVAATARGVRGWRPLAGRAGRPARGRRPGRPGRPARRRRPGRRRSGAAHPGPGNSRGNRQSRERSGPTGVDGAAPGRRHGRRSV